MKTNKKSILSVFSATIIALAITCTCLNVKAAVKQTKMGADTSKMAKDKMKMDKMKKDKKMKMKKDTTKMASKMSSKM